MTVQSIKAAFREARAEVKREVHAATVRVAEDAISYLISISPVYYGSYVLSHRASVNGSPIAGPTYLGFDSITTPRVVPAIAQAYREKAKRRLVSIVRNNKDTFARIEISNSVEHAPYVETIGWYIFGGSQADGAKTNWIPAHYCYSRTVNRTRARLPVLLHQERRYEL